jgi:hypothetical protein
MTDWVKIKQKTVLDTPTDKLTDALIGILSGIKGLYCVSFETYTFSCHSERSEA